MTPASTRLHPRFFHSQSGPRIEVPIFKIRGVELPATKPLPESAPVPRPEPPSHPEGPGPAPQGQMEPEITHAVLSAMDNLESLLSGHQQGGILITPSFNAVRPAPAPFLAKRPQAASSLKVGPHAYARPFWRRVLGGATLLFPVLGLSLLAGAVQGRAEVQERRNPPTHLLARTFPGALPTPALQPYHLRAEAGDPVAMRMLAFCYQEGVDTPRNEVEASRWQLQAALAAPGEANPTAAPAVGSR